MFRILAVPAALAAGVAAGLAAPAFSPALRSAAEPLLARLGAATVAERQAGHDHGHRDHARHDHPGRDHADHDHADHEPAGHDHAAGREEGVVTLNASQIEAAGIRVVAARPGTLARSLAVPGIVVPDGERVARVAAKVIGTVAELRKRLGESVEAGEVVAVLDSREVAEAKNDYIAALVGQDLQETLFERDHALWDKKISAEQQFLRARTGLVEARLKVDLARQKLSALGVPESEVAALADNPVAAKPGPGEDEHTVGLRRAPRLGLQRYELRAPIGGQVIERRVDLGAPVNDEGQEKEIYTIADLSRVWVELAVPVADLGGIRPGQAVSLMRGDEPATPGRIVFVSPILDRETRAAKVVASVENPDLAWRPGAFASVRIALPGEPAPILVPKAALQTVEGETVVFVARAGGFAKRPVTLGRGDGQAVALVSGVAEGEEVAAENSFVLKAELGKAEAEHGH
ncbi:cobalt-zinc-cadmium efflux system membrane fusion protein [Methylobacterium sp. BE186]|uniref:efflux RND transporter periplasmic adaptor subunit n=1 Tax=Methylobacterium sp. BE186 TaxID=2817715 RepID=UPI002854948A|nr:efflux RND transporter periplasmic adaptor subunit [Methylobacterium sp. BE186]MDR7037711.1 cobalt-zinc-cadmium efflux system membrane fusion protein [Methylobacterium sp. BE186]